MAVHPLAGQPAPPDSLIDVGRLRADYRGRRPNPAMAGERVAFGTSGHRGSAPLGSFNEGHVLAITQAICEYRRTQGTDGPLFIGKDTHALSGPAFESALEVLAANGVQVRVDGSAGGYTPTPAVSHAILVHNRRRSAGLADGIVITPSHNPPEDGGFKYNPPSGGPAETTATKWIERRANELLEDGLRGVSRIPLARALAADTTRPYDFVGTYVNDLASVVDEDAIRGVRLRIGVDPLGGASVAYWQPIVERFGLDLHVVNDTVDPTFRFMPLDWDGRIRMDCSSRFAMATLIGLKDRFDLAFGNDPDSDRHGIVTRQGLMNPNHYLAAAVFYLFTHRPGWRAEAGVGKTVVSSSLIDRVAAKVGRRLVEVPVGFKWFVSGLLDGSLGFGGEESAGASFLRRDGTVWTTDKDGVVMDLLAVEMMARTGRDPFEIYATLTGELGAPVYERIDTPATAGERAALGALSAADLQASTLAGDSVEAVITEAPGNGAAIGGVKVMTAHGWFAARPSGTEAVYKLYAESYRGPVHLSRIQEDARAMVADALARRKGRA